MVSGFYRRHSLTLLIFCIVALPVLTLLGERVKSDNNIETWLPRHSQVRIDYDSFCRTFGVDETILIAFEKPFPDSQRLTALASRVGGLHGVRTCWTRQQILEMMFANDVESDVAAERLLHLVATPGGDLETLLVVLDRDGVAQRGASVQAIRDQISYCQLENAVLAGGPVVATQLDHLGSRENSMSLFALTLFICFVLLHLNIGCWKTSGALMVTNILSIELTLATVWASGQQMNFIMGSLPVMVMVFTTAAAIHYIGHYRREIHRAEGIGRALQAVIRPSLFATGTTVIGLLSLAVSDIGPIPQFAIAAAYGTVYSFLIGVFVTPAILVAVRYDPSRQKGLQTRLERFAMFVVNHPWRVLVPGITITLVCSIGVYKLKSLIDPLEFLPSQDPVLKDTLLVKETLTSPTSIEAVVDFGQTESSFVERLRDIRRLESLLSDDENVCHTLSLADFFPAEITEQTFSPARLMAGSSGSGSTGSLLADGSRLWRVSIRLRDDSPKVLRRTVDSLRERCAEFPVTFTGMGPLLEQAQGDIFDGFWKSFASAFVLITIVMIVALRSVGAGLIAMIPNLTPILLVFGILGWCNYPIDIGIMMTASIALGLAVDGTFHFLFSYRSVVCDHGCRYRAVRHAVLQTGLPIISSAIISGTGLLALGLSPFRPTMRFGLLMFCLLIAALAGDLVLLPAFLSIGARRKRLQQPAPSAPAAQNRAA
ncbi:MAG: MMPL family transporter [Planctomycetaceae bacterium]